MVKSPSQPNGPTDTLNRNRLDSLFKKSHLDLLLGNFGAYLSNAGWQLVDSEKNFKVWQLGISSGEHAETSQLERASSSGELQIVLPQSTDLQDASELLQSALELLRSIERRPASLIADDIALGAADNIAFRLHPDTPSGQAPLGLITNSMEGIRRLLIGSSVALEDKRPVIPTRSSTKVTNYVNNVRIATAPGSFIVRVSVPLAESEKSLEIAQEDDEILFVEPGLQSPFGRKVSNRVRSTVSYSQELADRVLKDNASVSIFGAASPDAPNATELDALRRIGDFDMNALQYNLTIAQTPFSQWGKKAAYRQTLEPDHLEVFGEAADYLRQTKTISGLETRGYVVRLSREGGLGPGAVTIQTIVDDTGKVRKVRAQLEESDYDLAVSAHKAVIPVIIKGDLEPLRNSYRFKNITHFTSEQEIPGY